MLLPMSCLVPENPSPVIQPRAYHSMSQVDRRFHYIFTPFLNRQIALRISNARHHFLEHVAPNEKLCSLVRSVWSEADPDFTSDSSSPLSFMAQHLSAIEGLRVPDFCLVRRNGKGNVHYH